MSKLADLLPFLDTKLPAELGPGPRLGVETEASLNDRLQKTASWTGLVPETQELTRALILLWHDHLDSAHTIAQAVDNSDGAYVHGIMHRREPDYGNATYWFRRVGRHRAFSALAQQAGESLNSPADQALHQKLLRSSAWDPYGFIDACEQATRGAVPEAGERRLIELQRLEFKALLELLVS